MPQSPMWLHPESAGVRAGATLRWLENSGPRYIEVAMTFVGLRGGAAVLRSDVQGAVPREAMSFASWHICLNAAPGEVVILKVRL